MRILLMLPLLVLPSCFVPRQGAPNGLSVEELADKASHAEALIATDVKLYALKQDNDAVGSYSFDLEAHVEFHSPDSSARDENGRLRVVMQSSVKPRSCFFGTGKMLARFRSEAEEGKDCAVWCIEPRLVMAEPLTFSCPTLHASCH